MSLGIRSGVNWMRDGVHEQRLGETGNADDEAVAAGEQRQEHELHHVVLADDELGDLSADVLVAALQALRESEIVAVGAGDAFRDGKSHQWVSA
jgi:hypothetical protein